MKKISIICLVLIIVLASCQTRPNHNEDASYDNTSINTDDEKNTGYDPSESEKETENNEESTNHITNVSPEDQTTEKETENNEGSTNHIPNVSPEDQTTYYFKSYYDLNESLTNSKNEKYSTMISESTLYGDLFKYTLDNFLNKKISLMIPSFKKSPLELQDKEGFSNVLLLTNELYNLPWIWYYCTIDNTDIRVCISYPEVMNNAKVNQCDSYSKVRDIIAPNAPSPSNYTKFTSYSKIYEKELILDGGQKVLAVISELKENNDQYVMFLHNGVIVYLYADGSVFTNDFWSEFSVTEFK